jgi:glycosyltransferase involved in cell wall biosynthesis
MMRSNVPLREKLYFRALSWLEPRYQRLVYPRFQRCVVVTERDAHAIRTTVPGAKVAVIPNGVDTDYFKPVSASRGGSTLVFHGNLRYPPNIQAAVILAEEILPRVRVTVPEATLHLVGADPPARVRALVSRVGVRLSPNVPDIRDAVGSAAVYVCAIRHGTGVKNKLLEAMALGLPIVCYPPAIVGVDCRPGEHLLVSEDTAGFAAHVVDLLREPTRAAALGRSARALVTSQYSWESRARLFEALYEATASERLVDSDARVDCTPA